MFVSHAQFHVFSACVAFGGVIGILFLIVAPIKNIYVKVLFDVLIFCVICILFVVYSYKLQFGNFRFYMPFGVLIGISSCVLSFNFILKKFFYFIFNVKRKERNYDRGKKQKN